MTTHELAHSLLAGPDVPVSLIVTSGEYNSGRNYRNCPLATRVDSGVYNNLGGGSEYRVFIIAEKSHK